MDPGLRRGDEAKKLKVSPQENESSSRRRPEALFNSEAGHPLKGFNMDPGLRRGDESRKQQAVPQNIFRRISGLAKTPVFVPATNAPSRRVYEQR